MHSNGLRVSTEEQKEGWSPDGQRRTLEEFSEKNGLALVGVEEDLGHSGMFIERVGLDRVREKVRGGGVDAVIVLYRSCISRKNSHVEYLRNEFDRHGCKLVALNVQNNVHDPSAFLQEGVQGLFDEFQALQIKD